MPNLTTPIPPKLTGQGAEDISALKAWGTALIDELSYIFHNLDAGNVREAASVKAEHIDTTSAKIKNAQIGALTADKLVAGTVDTKQVKVADKGGTLEITDSKITISDTAHERFKAEYDKETGLFRFLLCNGRGEPTVYINSLGNAVFSGRVESSEIYASTIVGTDSVSYDAREGGVFADIDRTGIKVMQDKNLRRSQKIGMSVGDDGTAYLVLGEGDGTGGHIINGVIYTNGAFKIEKNEREATLGIVGSKAHLDLWENGELWLSGGRVLVNGRDILAELDSLKQQGKPII